MINKMQSTTLGGAFPPGPIHATHNKTMTSIPEQNQEKWQGPWFTDYGAGPFPTLEDLEAWLNHKIDVCIKVRQLRAGFPRFELSTSDLVLTHQNIAPRNLVVDPVGKLWLIDWGCAGIYRRGFEQAVLRE
ncbi:hypothetical protein B0H66DRAFT_306148 [Apodospora peruviana]|uniref:Aminoglycoside phosphotransferase domain-containing protein n=1 Tax=Apodospora peruviana TaxID=516989 RepID=A0AAE0I1G0_9PEZI|nr:hypothetical protein B0H66DRAFT_306148 [Apodospora peruviana]